MVKQARTYTYPSTKNLPNLDVLKKEKLKRRKKRVSNSYRNKRKQ
jgi:hypothetical protein